MLSIRFRGVMAVALLATTAVGCFRKDRTEDVGPFVFDAITTTRVTNKQWFDLKVYAVRAGAGRTSHALVGIAKAFTTQVFELPPDVVETRRIQISLDPIGTSRGYRTEPIHVMPGQQIHLVVPERLDQTYYSVFDPVSDSLPSR
jgi:hypothetical protein